MERVVSTPERFLDLAGSHRVRDSRPCRRHLGADAVKPGRDTLCLVEPLLQLIGAHVSQLWPQREGHERLAHGLFPSRDQRLRLVIRWKFVQESLQRGVVAVRHARPREDARPGVHLPANLCRDRALDLFLDPELTLPGRLERPVAMFQVDHMRLERGAGRIRFISVDGQFFVQAFHELGALFLQLIDPGPLRPHQRVRRLPPAKVLGQQAQALFFQVRGDAELLDRSRPALLGLEVCPVEIGALLFEIRPALGLLLLDLRPSQVRLQRGELLTDVLTCPRRRLGEPERPVAFLPRFGLAGRVRHAVLPCKEDHEDAENAEQERQRIDEVGQPNSGRDRQRSADIRRHLRPADQRPGFLPVRVLQSLG